MEEEKILIIGKGPGWELAPADVEAWGVNDIILKRDVDLLFHYHHTLSIIGDVTQDAAYRKAVRKKIPVIVKKNDAGLQYKRMVIYPRAEIVERFTDYFLSGVSLALAYAAFLGKKHVDLYGVNCANEEEYYFQRPCIEHWIGILRGQGCTVNVHGKSTLLKCVFDWTNIRSKDIFIQLTVNERQLLLQMLPGVGELGHVSTYNLVRRSIVFTDEEIKKLQMHQPQPGSPFRWLADVEDSMEPHTIKLTPRKFVHMGDMLNELRVKNQLTHEHNSLWAKFM